MPFDASLLSIVALLADGQAPLFNRLPIEAGIHLRWSFRPDLGFPKGGFRLYRRGYIVNPNEFDENQVIPESSWTQITQVTLPIYSPSDYPAPGAPFPNEAAEAFRRIAERYTGEFLEHYRSEVAKLISILHQLTSAGAIPSHQRLLEGSRGDRSNIRALDAVLLSGLDPYLARVLGLYWIDSSVSPGKPVDYRLEGLWNSQEYPRIAVSFSQASPDTLQKGDFTVDGVRLLSARQLTLKQPKLSSPPIALRLEGSRDLPLRIIFPRPVQEVEFRLNIASTSGWRVEATSPEGEALRVIPTRTNSGTLLIQESRRSIQRLHLFGNDGLWELSGFNYRERLGTIGILEAETYWKDFVNPSASAIVTPQILRLKQTSVPPTLNDEGRMPPTSAHVELQAQTLNGSKDYYRPVRMHVRRSGIMLTAPTSQTASLEMLADWSLESINLRDKRTGRSALSQGVTSFVPIHIEAPQRTCLRLEGTGFVEIRDRPDLQSLGTGLILQVWVNPALGQSFPTIIGNNFEQGFWLGLETRTYRFRLWLNTSLFQSNQGIPAGQWSHATVSYDGNNVRFYINGRLDSTYPARLGTVQANPLGTLCIGADSGSRPNALNLLKYPFKGHLADVRIWRRIASTSPASSGILAPVVYQHHDLVSAWELDGNLKNSKTNELARYQGTASKPFPTFVTAYQSEDPDRQVLALFGNDFVEILEHPEIQTLGMEFTLQILAAPAPNQASATLIGNNAAQSFWLGLTRVASGNYQVTLRLNGSTYSSNSELPASRWSRITVSYDSETVRFYMNGSLDRPQPARLGSVRSNPLNVVCIGADAGSHPGALNTPFSGGLAEIRIWRRALTPEQINLLLSKIPPSAQFIDRWLPDGNQSYQIQGIDLFGRVSGWSAARTIRVDDRTAPPPPINVHARYVPWIGSITNTRGIDSSPEQAVLEGDLELQTTLSIPLPNPPDTRPALTDVLESLIGYDVLITQEIRGKFYSQSFEITRVSLRNDRQLTVQVQRSPFSQLTPQPGDPVTLNFDLQLEVTWVWTGWQRLHAQRAQEFRLYLQRGPVNTLMGKLMSVVRDGSTFTVTTDTAFSGAANALASLWCQIGQSQYKVIGNTTGSNITLRLEYKAMPVVAPSESAEFRVNLPSEAPLGRDYRQASAWNERRLTIPVRNLPDERPISWSASRAEPVSDNEYGALREQVLWLSELPSSSSTVRVNDLYRVIVPTTSVPTSLQQTQIEDYVPGALIARMPAPDLTPPFSWQLFNVVWQTWNPSSGLLLYIRYEEPEVRGREPRVDIQQAINFTALTYYPGQRYQTFLDVPTAFGVGQATVEWLVGLTTADNKGNESGISQPVTVVAVNRKRPPLPPTPKIERIYPADYYGKSRVDMSWNLVGADITYHIYRAVDSAIFTRDMEQRRSRSGFYSSNKMPDVNQVLADDPDFEDWLRARFPSWLTNWRTQLFVSPKPSANEPLDEAEKAIWQRDRTAWEQATPVWRAWYERFYPALTKSQVQELAGREGNESAFALVNDCPVKGEEQTGVRMVDGRSEPYTYRYQDAVDGFARNRYLYRLRSQTPALQQSIGWGAVSEPEAPPKVKPPRAPVFTKVEAGDQTLTLNWALNREPDLKEYRLYRSQTPEELEDLRWWSDEPDPRLIATIPDPRLKVRNNQLQLPEDWNFEQVLGVYQVDEFDYGQPSPEIQTNALNYYISLLMARTLQLRHIADGTAIVVVYRDRSNKIRVSDRQRNTPPYADQGLLDFHDYYYRLITTDHAGNRSEGSRTLAGRSYSITVVPDITWIQARWQKIDPSQVSHEWLEEISVYQPAILIAGEVATSGIRLLIQRRTTTSNVWKSISEWLTVETSGERVWQFLDQTVDEVSTYIYRIRVVTDTRDEYYFDVPLIERRN